MYSALAAVSAQSGYLSRYLGVSVDRVLEEMAACGLIPAVAG